MRKSAINKVYEGKQILESTRAFFAQLEKYGVTEELITKLDNLIKEAEVLQGNYDTLFADKKGLTRKQDELITKVVGLTTIIKNFVRHITYDKILADNLHINNRIPTSVSKLVVEAKSIVSGVKEHQQNLVQKGFKPEVIDELEKAIQDLEREDTAQEHEKKDLKNITKKRDEVVDQLYDIYRYIQKVAKVVFANDEKNLNKFYKFIVVTGQKSTHESPVNGSGNTP